MPSLGSIPARTRTRAAAVRSRSPALAGRIPDRIRRCICRHFINHEIRCLIYYWCD